jgi:ABC-type lipoprotein export system ATPase subunit
MCRSMISDQEVIIYDEPTNFIDRNIKKILIDTIQELSFDKTIIAITHDSDMIKTCSRIIDLSDYH